MVDVSIIIVNYRSPDLVIDCVYSIYDKTKGINFEIIVVDNASGDDSISILTNKLGEKIVLIPSDTNLGFGKANNLGAEFAQGEYLFLLNPDTILVNNAVMILYDYLKKNPETGVAGGNLYTMDMSPAPSYCSEFDDLHTEKKKASWQYIFWRKIRDKLGSSDKKSFMKEFNYTNNNLSVAYVFGADMMVKKSVFESISGFDPDFFMYGEEAELSWRIIQEGYLIRNIPEAKIIHLDGATVKPQNVFSQQQFKMRMHGSLTYYKKRFGIKGVKTFYKLRIKRYDRIILIARLQHKLTNHFEPLIQKQCLEEVYKKFIEMYE